MQGFERSAAAAAGGRPARHAAPRGARHARTGSWWRGARARRLIGGVTALVLGGAGLTAAALPATAATVYELEGSWADTTPATLETGDAVSATWWFNLNDDAAAPGNAPV